MPSSIVYDVSFIPERSVHSRVQALPSARVMAQQSGVDLSAVKSRSHYVGVKDVRSHVEANTYPLKNEKCAYVTKSLDCIVGGFGHIGCLDEKFHEQCSFKALVFKVLAEREKRRPGEQKNLS